MSKSSQQPRPKTMSSRLMTMKFMQRAAASSPTTTSQSPAELSEAPPSKRQKTSNITTSPTTPTSQPQMIQVALEEEEEKRQRAIARLAEEAGETKWVFSTVDGESQLSGLRVATAGYSDIDQEAWRSNMVGRRRFGKVNRELEEPKDGTSDQTSSSSEEASDDEGDENEDGSDSDDPSGTKELIKASKEDATRRQNVKKLERKQQRKAKKAELARLAEKRRSKEIKLNKLSSISGGGGGSGIMPNSSKADRECYSCGEKGHEKRDCPQSGKRKGENGLARRSKKSRPSLDC